MHWNLETLFHTRAYFHFLTLDKYEYSIESRLFLMWKKSTSKSSHVVGGEIPQKQSLLHLGKTCPANSVRKGIFKPPRNSNSPFRYFALAIWASHTLVAFHLEIQIFIRVHFRFGARILQFYSDQ